MRILIAGGFGFVGGRLGVHLAKQGHKILLGSRKSICPPAWLEEAEVVHMNWDDPTSLAFCCKGVDVLIHAAGMNAQQCAIDPVGALEFNGVATARLVNAASYAGVRMILYLSTAHVYANTLEGTITEDTCPRNLHPYATSHLAGEHAVLGANQQGDIQGIVLRLSNAFGAPMSKNVNCWMLLVNDLCRQAVQTHKLILQSTGKQHRDFISLYEVCQKFERFINHIDSHFQRGVFNIGLGRSQSVLSMAQRIQQRCLTVLGFIPELEYKQDLKEENFAPLIYKTTRLNATDPTLDTNNNIKEIDGLLRYCSSTYPKI